MPSAVRERAMMARRDGFAPSLLSALVVDDEPDMRTSYERFLKRLGYRVVQAGTRRDGLAVIQAEPLVLVVSDLRLRDGSGLDVVAAAYAAPIRVPSIVVTGSPSALNRRAAMEAGAAGFLAKPFSAQEFTGLVGQVIGSPRD
jgi:two-component system response regulator PilR (NtrC family)